MALVVTKFYPSVLPFALGHPDVDKAVNANLSWLERVGVGVTEDSLRADCQALANLGFAGRLYVELPFSVPFMARLAAVESLRPKKVTEAFVSRHFWTPGAYKGNLTDTELNGGVTSYSVRLALFSNDPGDYDPLLHFRGQPFDEYLQPDGVTQLDSIKHATEEFARRYPGFELGTWGGRDYLSFVGQDRLSGIKPDSEAFVLNRGRVADVEHGRCTVNGGTHVGIVCSDGGQPDFNGWSGSAICGIGVGLSVGLAE